jgi:hypothetical protein
MYSLWVLAAVHANALRTCLFRHNNAQNGANMPTHPVYDSFPDISEEINEV